MGQILRNWRVVIATLCSVLLVIGAYLLAKGIEIPPTAQASAETALLQAITSKDSDNDGLPDWEEALYGTDPHNPDSFHLGMTDGEAVAKGLIVPKAVAPPPPADALAATSSSNGTLTDAFAQVFFNLYLSAKQANGGADLTADQTNVLANQAMKDFIEHASPSAHLKTVADLTISGSGDDALRQFAALATGVFARYQSPTPQNELQTIQYSLEGGDGQASENIVSLGSVYENYALGLAALPIPHELAGPMLDLINAFLTRGTMYRTFATVNADPLAAIVSLEGFSQNELSLRQAFAQIGSIYRDSGVQASSPDSAALFIRAAMSFGDSQP